jgi:putative metalloprotease
MLRLAPVLAAILIGLIMYLLSAWRTLRELDANSAPLTDPNLARLTARMARALDVPGLVVNLYEIPQINGLAAPDGRIFITRGFWQAHRRGDVTIEEMASVVAHELGHVALGHARRRMIDFSGQNAIRVVLTMLLARFVPGFGAAIAGFLATLVASRLSRQDEFEADAWAAALLIKAGIGTGPQVSLLEKLPGLTGQTGQPPAWLLSHPKTDDRVAAIRQLSGRA